MKKLIVSLLILCLLCCSGCEHESENIESRAERGVIEYVDLTDEIVADKDTHILYYLDYIGETAYMCPYYSENGKICKYEDGKIMEVENDNK